MPPTRLARREKARAQRRRALRRGAVVFAILVAVVVAVGVLHDLSDAQGRKGGGSASAPPVFTGPSVASRPESATAAGDEAFLAYTPDASSDATLVEVPAVVGRQLTEARVLLAAADLDCSASSAGVAKDLCVVSQEPRAGSITVAGASVQLGFAKVPKTPTAGLATPTLVVCIDPGHQSHSNTAKEPIGPGSTVMKQKVTGGATGVGTRIPEYEIALQIAMNVRARLAKSGVRVVMTRTTNDVNISNAQRAQIANRARAALFVRIHANGSPDSRRVGVSTLYPSVTRWTKATSAPSRRAAFAVHRAVVAAASAPSDGIVARSDLAGFNWCTRPAILIECGYLSNPVEDKLLASPKYQDKIAAGIATGVLRFLGR